MPEYLIHEANLGKVTDLAARLNKRAVKLGLDPIVVTLGAPIQKPRRHDCVAGPGLCAKCRLLDTYIPTTVEGRAPKLAGWTFVAALDYVTDDAGVQVVLLRVAPDQTLPEVYRQADRHCDHCKLSRQRTSTYVVHHDDGRYAQVGSNCLADFLGHRDPAKIAEWLDGLVGLFAVLSASEEYEGHDGSGWSHHAGLGTVLALAAAAIDQYGWVSKKVARAEDREATADRVNHELHHRHCQNHAKHAVILAQAHVDEAEQVVEWARALAEREGTLSDYLHNVTVLARLSVIDLRYLGVAVSMVAAYRREQERLRARERQVSQPIGIVGKREIFTLTLLGSTPIESQWGVTLLYRFEDAVGNRVKYFSSRDLGLTAGETYQVKATVKAHGEWGGVRETTITRGAVLETVQAAPQEVGK